jgi:F0F1-type ATP synthase membrane subunit b/b'
MTVLHQLVRDEIDRRRELVTEADLRLADAKTQLEEARVNAKRAHDEFDYLKAWLAAETASPDWAS